MGEKVFQTYLWLGKNSSGKNRGKKENEKVKRKESKKGEMVNKKGGKGGRREKKRRKWDQGK